MRKVLWWIVFIAIIVRLAFFIFANKNYFLRSFDFEYFSTLYSESQYVKGELSKGGIGDDGLYAFAGYYYLFQGKDVTTVNFEHPPIGKYLIGVSIFLFKNENVINIIYFVILFFLSYKIGNFILKNKLLSLFGVFILSIDPLFNDHLLRSLLDLPFTVFFISAVYFFLLSFTNSKYFYLSFLFWGGAFSTKFFPFLAGLYLYLLVIIFFYERKKLPVFFIASFWIPIIYIVCHVSFFFYHPSIIEFLRHKKWMLSWFKGAPKIFGNLLRNIFTATYLDSTFALKRNKYWTFILPMITVFSTSRFRLSMIDKKNLNTFFMYGLSVIYFIYTACFTMGLIKYLMPVYPLMIILALGNIHNIYSIINSWRQKNLSKSKAKS